MNTKGSFRFNLYSPQMRARQKKFDETDQKAPIWVKIREEMDGRIRIDSDSFMVKKFEKKLESGPVCRLQPHLSAKT
ncbi:hypothetical protein B9Z55_028801 [Caenorhabditis nigoni]|uniref:Uncharacterized protein n=1 Tax=Caenorhabditis nigoni TaxID=1611254 RepID=A0A2G5SAB9_9PELO|nr:hypothetical protein B9Z55_028801 [Caenorhabditis nigoni]